MGTAAVESDQETEIDWTSILIEDLIITYTRTAKSVRLSLRYSHAAFRCW